MSSKPSRNLSFGDPSRRSTGWKPRAAAAVLIVLLASLLAAGPSHGADRPPAPFDPPLSERGRLGPFRLHTDVADDDLLRHLDRVARETVDSYSELLGVVPEDLETLDLYLFRDPEAYLAYAKDSAPALHTKGGHTSRGTAAVVVGDSSSRVVGPILIHEIVHLLNQASFGAPRPPWIEEGLANAFSYSRLSTRYRLQFDSLNGRMDLGRRWELSPSDHPLDRRLLGHVEMTGGKAALKRLVDRVDARATIPAETLVRVPWEPFRDHRVREDLYIHSGLFLRFLLLAEEGRYAEGVQGYLASLEADPASPTSLVDHLSVGWSELDSSFHEWLRLQAFAAGVDRHSDPAWIVRSPDDELRSPRRCGESGTRGGQAGCS